jgi:hypothetical protein
MTEKQRDAVSQLRAELAVERKKREFVEAHLLQLLELLAPHLKMTKEECREGYQAFTAYQGLPS